MTDLTAIRDSRIGGLEELREVTGQPAEMVIRKDIGRLEEVSANFIANSPFVLVATSAASGRCDVSPRGDPAGFVRVLDEHTLAIPERPGNRRADTLINIIENPHIGLIFLIPGVEDTLRVNGRASVVREPALLESMAHQGKAPSLAILVDVEECFLHCAKAFRRSGLWDVDPLRERAVPTSGAMFREMMGLQAVCTAEQVDADLEKSIQTTLY